MPLSHLKLTASVICALLLSPELHLACHRCLRVSELALVCDTDGVSNSLVASIVTPKHV